MNKWFDCKSEYRFKSFSSNILHYTGTRGLYDRWRVSLPAVAFCMKTAMVKTSWSLIYLHANRNFPPWYLLAYRWLWVGKTDSSMSPIQVRNSNIRLTSKRIYWNVHQIHYAMLHSSFRNWACHEFSLQLTSLPNRPSKTKRLQRGTSWKKTLPLVSVHNKVTKTLPSFWPNKSCCKSSTRSGH